MYKSKYIHPIHPEVQFGVELKEIYPPWYLHPTLKNLMYLAQINIRNENSTRFNIDEICGKSHVDGPLRQRLKLKELICNGTNILNLKIPTGAPLWMLRHFLGLLPNPIFASKSDPDHWFKFATNCYRQLILSIKTRKNSDGLKATIALELAHLPERNLTFMYEFFHLLRFLSSKTNSETQEESIDNHAALVLAKYFFPSLFMRPYTPGIVRTIDKKYITLILYIIYFWPELQKQIYDILISSIDKNEKKLQYFSDCSKKYAENNDYLKDIGVQTETDFDNIENIKNKDSELCLNLTEISELQLITSEENLEEKVEEKMVDKFLLDDDLSKMDAIYDGCNLYLDSPTSKEFMNDSMIVSTPCNPPKTSTVSLDKPKLRKRSRCEKALKTRSETSSICSGKSKRVKVVSKKIRKCLRHSKCYEIIILELPYKVKKVNSRNIKITTLQKNLKDKESPRPQKKKRDLSKVKRNKKKDDIETKQDEKKTEGVIKYETDNNQLIDISKGEYIYDTFIGKDHEQTNCFNFNKIKKNPFISKIDTSSSTYIDFNSPTRSFDINLRSFDKSLYERIKKFGWSYTKSCRSKLNLNVPHPSESEMQPYEICFDSEHNSMNDSSVPLTQNCQIENCTATGKNNKSILENLKKVGARLKLFKMTAKVSASCEDLQCNVKYKKILKSSYSI